MPNNSVIQNRIKESMKALVASMNAHMVAHDFSRDANFSITPEYKYLLSYCRGIAMLADALELAGDDMVGAYVDFTVFQINDGYLSARDYQ